ncbi:hypothetical protein GGH92_004647 [Coemansia sp. RSA 2673]|nr:hypothetical protein GGH92_004647 [Coemansia sp. RSA 2673]
MKLASAIAVLAAVIATVSADTRGPTSGQDLCCAANQERARRGIPSLKWSPSIDRAAQQQSEYQRSIGRISHDGPPGQLNKLGGRLQSVGFGYRTAGENIGGGFNNVNDVTATWMNSPGHKAAILGRESTVCGGGLANGGYYTINFASPMNKNDEKGYYNLQCSGSKSLGAYTDGDNAIPHKPQPPVVQPPKPPVAPPTPKPQPPPKPPVQPPKPPVVQPPTPKPPVVQPPTPKPPVVQPQPPVVGHKPTPQPQPPVQPPVQPQPPVKPPTPGNGKCKLVPKGSIAAGKCKPCKQCGSKPSPFRR